MKKILSVALVLTLILGTFCVFPASAEELPEGQLSGDYWYNVLDDGTAEITGYEGNDDIITVPAEIEDYKVTSIGIGAFLSATATEVILPDTVTTIKTSAFRIMRNLEKIHIPESVTVIEQYAFEYCESLSSITFPENLEEIGREVLDYTPYYNNPDNWENGVLYSGNYALSAKESIVGVCEIKEGTTLIADYALRGLLEVDEFKLPQSLKHIGDSSFASCPSVKSITIPENVISINDNAFFNCQALESLTLPESIRNIGESVLNDTAYYNNSDNWQDGVLYAGDALISAPIDSGGECKIKDGTRIVAKNAFEAFNITSLIMPDSVKYIGESAFAACYKLENVRISENLKEIGKWAFSGCISLTDINIPDSVVKIGEEAFVNCRSLTKVIVPESVEEIGYCALGYERGFPNYRYIDFKLYGTKGSAAEEYARRRAIPFVAVKEAYKENVLSLLNLNEKSYYFEEYEHFSTTDEATPDFVLISAYDSWDATTPYTERFGNYILHRTNARNADKGLGYYIYLPETNEIFTLSEAFENGIEGVYSVFTQGILGELIGDTNNDGKFSIQDATIIQKYIAGLEYIPNYFKNASFTDLVADFNKDDKLNVKDATAIQKHIAGINKVSIEHKVLEMYQLSSSTVLNEVITIARNKTQLTDVMLKISPDATLDEMFTDEYFKENSVVVIANCIGGIDCCTQIISNLAIKDNTLMVTRLRNSHEACNDEPNYQCVLLEVNKEQVKVISDIEIIDQWVIICY